MIRLITLLFFCFLLNIGTAQLFLHQPNLYYEYPYFEDGDGCYYLSVETDSSLLSYNKEFEAYIDLKIFDLQINMKYFTEDDDGYYYCPYERENKKDIKRSKAYVSKAQESHSLSHYYDTIYVIRNEPSDAYNPTRRRGGDNTKEFSFESIPLITSFSKEVQDKLINVQMEFREGDVITGEGKLKVVCPYSITVDVIKEVNSKLIKVGYLSNKKRGKYHGAIRDALYEYQVDNNMVVGFIDQETIKALKLDIRIE